MSQLDSRPPGALRRARLPGALGAVAVLGVLAAGPAAAADFGPGPLTGPGVSAASPGAAVRSVTVGRHATYDRVVFTAETGLPRWELRYVPRVMQDASGKPVPLDGEADLYLVLRGTNWIDHPSQPRYLTPRYPGLRQVSAAGEFEGDLSYGIGQATRAGFRAFTLTGPNRLVVDVAHPAPGAARSGPAGAPTPVPSAEPSPVSTPGSAPDAGGGGPAPGEVVDAAGVPDQVAGGDSGSDGSRTALLIGGGLLLLGALTAAGFLVHVRRFR